MTEQMTLAIMIGLAVIGGFIIAVITKKQNRPICDIKVLFSLLLYCYFEYWLMNIWRTVLLRGQNIYPYSENRMFIIMDIAMVIVGVMIVYEWQKTASQRCIWIRLGLCIVLAIYHVGMIIFHYLTLENFNAAVYQSLLPDKVSFFGVLFFLICALLCSVIESRTREKLEKVDIAVVALFLMTIFVYPLLETYITNAGEFSFSAGQVLGCLVLMAIGLGIGAVLSCVLISGRLRKVYLFVLWAFSICAYIQGMFLNGSLFLMDGKAAEWSMGLEVGNMAFWCFLFMMLCLSFKLFKNKWKEIVLFSSVMLCLMQMVGGVSLLPNYVGNQEKHVRGQNYFSTQGLYEVAKEENIVVFVLDTYDVNHVSEVLEKYPDFLAPLKGFTYFPDTVAQFSRTFPSIPYMLTGEKYFYEIPLSEYVDEAFVNCSLWDGLREKEYQLYFYEEDEAYIGASVREVAQNYVEEGHTIEEKVSFAGCIESAVRINGYRLLPYALKECYFYTASTINNMVIEEFTLEKPEFVADDASVYQGLREQELKINEEGKALRFIHLYGAHEPYMMDENGNRVNVGEGSGVAQYVGCMNMIYEYIAMLQKLGVYENTTIIITADHGENFLDEQLTETTNPILFIKPYGIGADKDMSISDTYASQEDMLPTIAALHNIDYAGKEGMDLLAESVSNKDRIRKHYYTVVEGTTQTRIREYEIKGCSLEFQNWHATDVYHEFGEYR